jgi:hypothetical protein
MRSILTALFLLSIICAAPASANQTKRIVEIDLPEAGVIQRLTLSDGSQIFGQVESIDTDLIGFRSIAGVVMTVPRGNIVDLRVARGRMVDGEFLPQDSHNTRLMFAPTGRSLRRGEGYLGFYYILPFVQVGVTDRFSIGGGTPLVFGFDESERPFWITPKLQVLDAGQTQLALGAIHGFDLDGDGGGIAYGVLTTGRADASVTAGAGVAYSMDGGRAAVVMVGGERRIRRSVKILTENYIWQGGDGILSGGFRFFGERLSADLALAVPIGADALYAFPVVNFVYVF